MTQNRNLSILADQVNSSGVLGYAGGGTGLSAVPTNGQLNIGNGSGFTRATLTAGSNIAITNGAGSISIATTGLSSGFSNMQVYTSGTNTWTVPAGVTQCKVTVVGGGGGGGGGASGAGGGGGAGGCSIRYVTGLTPGGTVTATVGAGGAAGVSNNNGSAGGTSSFGAYASATGGSGGTGTSSYGGGAGGTGSSGNLNISGGYGTTGAELAVGDIQISGAGGNSVLGGGGRNGAYSNSGHPVTPTAGATNTGGGGGSNTSAGGGAAAAGGSGVVIIEY